MSNGLEEIALHRMACQQLCGTSLSSPDELIEWFAAIQGQEYAQSIWSMGLRLKHLKFHDIEEFIEEGKILRTHLLRPTWHLVSAADIKWMLELTAPRVHAVNAYMYRQTELEKRLLIRCMDLLAVMLEGHKQLTRNEINEVFKNNGIIADGHRLSYIMMYAELEGLICSGKKKGKQFTYALLDERVNKSKVMDREEALVLLTKRYFISRGPATIHDYSTWSGLSVADCRKGIEALGKKLGKRTCEDNNYYFSVDIPGVETINNKIFLLSIYDEMIMGYKKREPNLVYRNTLNPSPENFYNNTFLWNTQIAGTWRRTINNRNIEINYQPYRKLGAKQEKAFEESIAEYANFHSLAVEVHSS